MLPTVCVCVSVCVHVCLQTSPAASVSPLVDRVCVVVCLRESENEMCLPTGQRQTHARESRAVSSVSPCAVLRISKSMSLLTLAVKPISHASYATTKPQQGWRLCAATWINSDAGCWFTSTFFGENTHKLLSCIAQQEKRSCLTGQGRTASQHLVRTIHLWRRFLAIYWSCTSTKMLLDF